MPSFYCKPFGLNVRLFFRLPPAAGALLSLMLSSMLSASGTMLRSYDLPSGDATSTLKQFVEQSGEQVFYIVSKIQGVKTNPVRGRLNARAALDLMLADTGLIVIQDKKTGAFMISRTRSDAKSDKKSFSEPNPKPMKIPGRFSQLTAIIALAATPFAEAQGTAPLSSGSDSGDDLVTLPAFSVTSSEDGSYHASDSLVGSRVRTEIRDLPYNLNVVTSEFIRDFAAFDIAEELAYTSSFANGQSADVDYVLRGMAVNTQLRNGFRADYLRSSVSTERVEVIKGPSAAIYGQSSPGGLINTITKKPKTKPGGNFRMSFGSYNTRRFEVEYSSPLGGSNAPSLLKNTYYLVTLADYYSENEQEFAYKQQTQGSLVFTKKFGPKTSLTFEGEYILVDSRRTIAVPYLRESIGGRNVSTGLVYEDTYNFSPNTPEAFDYRPQGASFLTFEHEFNRTLAMKTALGYSQARANLFNYVGTDTVQLNPLRYTGRVPERAVQGRYAHGLQNDFIASYQRMGMHLRTLFTLDYSFSRTTRSNMRLPSNSPFNVATLRVDTPNYYIVPYDPVLFTQSNGENDNRAGIYGAFLRQQVDALNGRLVAMAGARYDYVRFDLRNLQAGVQNPGDTYTSDAITPQVGVNYKLTKNFVVYGNRSQSFTPPTSGSNPGSINRGTSPKNQEGLGYELGIKGALFDQKLNFAIAWFLIDRKNVQVTDIDENTLISETTYTGLERGRGAEIDFNWKFNKSLQLFGGYGYSDAFVVEAGRDLDAIGRPPRSSPMHKGGAGLRFAMPKNFLAGLVFTAGVTYTGQWYPNNPTSGGTTGGDGFIRIHNGRRDIKVPSATLMNMGMSYSFKTKRVSAKSLTHKFQINAKNVFDQKYIATNFRVGDRLTLIGSYGLSF